MPLVTRRGLPGDVRRNREAQTNRDKLDRPVVAAALGERTEDLDDYVISEAVDPMLRGDGSQPAQKAFFRGSIPAGCLAAPPR
jgi:hypothetical protein